MLYNAFYCPLCRYHVVCHKKRYFMPCKPPSLSHLYRNFFRIWKKLIQSHYNATYFWHKKEDAPRGTPS